MTIIQVHIRFVMYYNKFLTNCSPIPPANIDGTLMNDSMFNSPIPDKPWPLSKNAHNIINPVLVYK